MDRGHQTKAWIDLHTFGKVELWGVHYNGYVKLFDNKIDAETYLDLLETTVKQKKSFLKCITKLLLRWINVG